MVMSSSLTAAVVVDARRPWRPAGRPRCSCPRPARHRVTPQRVGQGHEGDDTDDARAATSRVPSVIGVTQPPPTPTG